MRLIEDALADRQSRTRPRGRTWPDVELALANLPDQCVPELIEHARRLIGNLPDIDEGELAVVLGGIGRYQPTADAAKPVLQDAIRSPHTHLKENYAEILADSFGRAEAVEPLDDVLRQAGRPDLVPAIGALYALRAEASAPLVRQYVENSDASLRNNAIGFLYEFDTIAAAPIFLKRFNAESDPEIMRTLADGLVRWRYVEAASALVTRAERTADESLREHLVRAADDLLEQDVR